MFNSVDMNMFNLIGICTCAREAWEKLQTHCEGSASFKKTRMRLLTSKFEKLRMEESETIMEYNGRLKSLKNEASVLGDPISNKRLVSKVLRSVPKTFHTKVCAIDESKDTSIMGLDELISYLCTYEMEMEAEDDTKEVKESDLEENSISLISKKFTDYLKVMKEKKDMKGAQHSKFPRLPTLEKLEKPATTRGHRQSYEGKIQSSIKSFDNVQCRECKGYGHYAYECANRLRKGMNVSLSDDDSEGEQEKAEHADLISFTAFLESKKKFQINPLGVGSGVATPGCNTVQKSVCFVASNLDNSSDHEEHVDDAYTLEGIQKLYEELYCDWIKRNQLNTTFSKENTEFKAVMARLEVLMSMKDLKLGLLNLELEKANATFARFNSSSNKLDNILTMGKDDKFGLGFKERVFETGESSKTPVFVKEGSDSLNHPSTASKGKKLIVEKNVSVPKPKQWKRPFVLPLMLHNTKSNTGRKGHTVNKVWEQKSDVKRLKDHLTDYIEQNGGRVTYGGVAKGRIVGKGTLNVKGFPKLHNVLHVEGLNANLISISQLCDDGLHVKFDKNTCEVFYNANHCVVTGTRSVDNCYQLGEELACRKSKVDEFSLWHQKLGHVNLKTLKNLSKFEAVRGLPNLKSGVPYVCGTCQEGKQTRVSHPMLQHCGTTRCLELLHMDLMGPMEVESYGGKKYSLGISQEFSAPKTPQQNGIAERKNRRLQEMARVMMSSNNISKRFRAEALNTACHISNRVYLRSETVHEENSQNNEETEVITEKDIPSKIHKNHPSSQIIGDVHGTRQTRATEKVDYRKMVGLVCMSSVYSQVMRSCFVSNIEPKNVNDALNDEFWVNAMHEELEQFV
ncbi:uncharacterized protein [Henckelia pumila]|uniref:uncharacterized protein n=1 Tax=Henckelia pumila TaxID=405737 RepID=UPI003C6E9077